MGSSGLLLIFVLAIILFGPEDLPVIAKAIGRIVRFARTNTNDIVHEFQKIINEPLPNNTRAEETEKQTQEENKTEERTIAEDGDYLTFDEETETQEVIQITTADIANLITKICSNVVGSSISYDVITRSREYEAIINLKEDALHEILLLFEETESDGLEEFVMAMICSNILGYDTEFAFSSGKEWFEDYRKNANQ